jgi:hypothetical protein
MAEAMTAVALAAIALNEPEAVEAVAADSL